MYDAKSMSIDKLSSNGKNVQRYLKVLLHYIVVFWNTIDVTQLHKDYT